MERVQYGALRGFRCSHLDQAETPLRHVFGARAPSGIGNLSLSGSRNREAALQCRAGWSRYLEIEPRDWVVGGQVHGAVVRVVEEQDRGRGALQPEDVIPCCDGLITQTLGLPLYIAVADCSAVLLLGPGVLGLIHGGWRGLSQGILQNAVDTIAKLGVEAKQLRAAVGPCIAGDSYEVGPEVGEHAPAAAKYPGCGDRWQVDMALWAAHCLKEAGLSQSAVYLSGVDTGVDEACFSHRRQGTGAGRNGFLAVLSAPPSRP